VVVIDLFIYRFFLLLKDLNSLYKILSLVQKEHRKALDVLNTVGLSNSVLKLIERRHRVDNWIKYAGMILTLVIMFIIWRWT
jgi:hypothetical protein